MPKAILLEKGKSVMIGTAKEVTDAYLKKKSYQMIKE